MTDAARPALSVVAPCFNEEGVLPAFLARVAAVLDGIAGSSEIVSVKRPHQDRRTSGHDEDVGKSLAS